MVEDRLQSGDSQEAVGLLIGDDEAVIRWHTEQTGQNPLSIQTGTFVTIGITLRDKLIASVLFSRYRWPDIEVHIHSTDPRWCNRRTLRAIFNYPFKQLNCTRVTAVTDPANQAVCQFLERVGFKEEGRQRQALPSGDSLLLGMLKNECKWVN